MTTPPATRWLYDDPASSYHDSHCPCDGHCRNCFADLLEIRTLHARLIAEGSPAAPAAPLHPKARYCSDWCRGRAKRERALDRALAAAGFCHWCKTTRPAAELEPFNTAGNLACKRIARCAIRQLTDTQRAELATLTAAAITACAACEPDCTGGRWQLAEQIATAIGADHDLASLLAVTLWADPHAAGEPAPA